MCTLHVCAWANMPSLRMLILLGRCVEVVGEAKRERPVVGGGLAAASGLSGWACGRPVSTHQILLFLAPSLREEFRSPLRCCGSWRSP